VQGRRRVRGSELIAARLIGTNKDLYYYLGATKEQSEMQSLIKKAIHTLTIHESRLQLTHLSLLTFPYYLNWLTSDSQWGGTGNPHSKLIYTSWRDDSIAIDET
jgi:hypothetical protein